MVTRVLVDTSALLALIDADDAGHTAIGAAFAAHIDDELRAQGISRGNPIVRGYDVSAAIGGRSLLNRLWFLVSCMRITPWRVSVTMTFITMNLIVIIRQVRRYIV